MPRDGMPCACYTQWPGGQYHPCSHHAEVDRLAALIDELPPSEWMYCDALGLLHGVRCVAS